jgi:hypothetical protein
MKVLKILIAAVVITVFDVVVGGITCGGLFKWVYELEPTNIWRVMQGPPGIEFYIGAAALNIVFVLVYALLAKGIPGKNRLLKGLIYGLCVWAVGVLPGMFATYMFMTVAATVVIYLTISELVFTPLRGLIIAAIYGQY